MEEQSDHVIHQATPSKILGRACWNLQSRGVVLWEEGRACKDYWVLKHSLLQTSYTRVLWTDKRRNEEAAGRQLYDGTQLQQGNSDILLIL